MQTRVKWFVKYLASKAELTLKTGRYNLDRHRHKWNLSSCAICIGKMHRSLLAIRRVIVIIGKNFSIKSLFEARFDGINFFFFRDDNEIVFARMTNKIRGCAKFIDTITSPSSMAVNRSTSLPASMPYTSLNGSKFLMRASSSLMAGRCGAADP